jgi:transporter family-2 protein
VTAILALGLLGQSIAGIVVDQFGLCGMPKHPFSKHKLAGLALILVGIAFMINSFELMAVAMSFFAGASIIISRTLNGKLADLSSVRISTLFNYIVGLAGAVIVFFIIGGGEALYPNFSVVQLSPNWWIYLGGMLGVTVVLICNTIIAKISAFYLTLFIFIGQVFSGIAVDIIIFREFSYRALIGGAFVAMGLSCNLLLDKKRHA